MDLEDLGCSAQALRVLRMCRLPAFVNEILTWGAAAFLDAGVVQTRAERLRGPSAGQGTRPTVHFHSLP